MGRGLATHLQETGRPLLTTFYASAISADHYGCAPVYCVVTDSDIHRIWVPLHPERSRIVYLTPTRRALKRLRAYGVAREQIELTGFPLPHELLGGPDLPVLKQNLAARLVRLDRKKVFRSQTRNEIQHFLGDLPHDQEGRPPLAVFTVGGAGAQANLARALLRSLKPRLEEGRLRSAWSRGCAQEIADKFHDWIDDAGLASHLGPVDRAAVSVEVADSLDSYFPRFNQLLAETDILWTKPSEMTFFSALGIPLVLRRRSGTTSGTTGAGPSRTAAASGSGIPITPGSGSASGSPKGRSPPRPGSASSAPRSSGSTRSSNGLVCRRRRRRRPPPSWAPRQLVSRGAPWHADLASPWCGRAERLPWRSGAFRQPRPNAPTESTTRTLSARSARGSRESIASIFRRIFAGTAPNRCSICRSTTRRIRPTACRLAVSAPERSLPFSLLSLSFPFHSLLDPFSIPRASACPNQVSSMVLISSLPSRSSSRWSSRASCSVNCT